MAVLTARDVKKSFKLPGMAPVEVLKDVSLEIEKGEKVAVLGRSGAGKSTLLNILGGLMKPDSGSVSRPRRIGFVFQSYHLMPELTVLENVLLPAMAARLEMSAAKKRALELIDRVGLIDRAGHLPAELSGGECQRIALARALAVSPPLVLADEPTGNLDAMTGAEILKVLAGLSAGDTALVMVTHSMEAAAICDRSLELSGGEIAPRGNPARGIMV